jgi:hypothetical protein
VGGMAEVAASLDHSSRGSVGLGEAYL